MKQVALTRCGGDAGSAHEMMGIPGVWRGMLGSHSMTRQ
jgi:hypothetical protein